MTDKSPIDTPLPPNSTIGIVGGGQLGRMLASSAAKLGFRTIVLEPQEDCPAAQLCNRQIIAAYDDEAALSELAMACDVVTYEFENVPLTAADYLQKRLTLSPPAKALEVAQDRLAEKQFLESHGVPIAKFHAVDSVGDLSDGLQKFGDAVLKTCRFGYDGKGQHVFRSSDKVNKDSLSSVLGSTGASDGAIRWVLEKRISFEREFSIVAARAGDGTILLYDAAENIHESGILRRSIVPASTSPKKLNAAKDHVETILIALNYVGVIGVEFFDTIDGVLVNEIAPRVHNTGHWTVEACPTSQFDQHIRAISGLELGDVRTRGSFEMVNLLGNEAEEIASCLNDDTVQVTLYGKVQARPGRKMGHLTRMLNNRH